MTKPLVETIAELRELLTRAATTGEYADWRRWSQATIKAFPALLTAAEAKEKAEARVKELEEIVRGFLDCPDIEDCAFEDLHPETVRLIERAERAVPEPKEGT